MKKPRFVELFAGVGLVRLAFQNRGWKCVWANDIDEKKVQDYNLNFGESDIECSDIWEIDKSKLPNPVELVTASFPCTDLSVAGYRKGLAGKESGSFFAVISILEYYENQGVPVPIVFLENVVGFLTSNGGKDFRSALLLLSERGYFVDVVLLDAVRFTPQSRPRLFVIAVKESFASGRMVHSPPDEILGPWDDLMESENARLLRPEALRDFIKTNPEINWAHFDLPRPPAFSERCLDDIVEVLNPDDKRWWSEERVVKILSQLSERNLLKLEVMRAMGRRTHGTVYRRMRKGRSMAELRDDQIAGCLRTPKGGSSRQILLEVNGSATRVRLLTGREYARLQGVPDDFLINPNEVQACYDFGDAVCVPAVEWLADNIVNPLLDNESFTERRQISYAQTSI